MAYIKASEEEIFDYISDALKEEKATPIREERPVEVNDTLNEIEDEYLHGMSISQEEYLLMWNGIMENPNVYDFDSIHITDSENNTSLEAPSMSEMEKCQKRTSNRDNMHGPAVVNRTSVEGQSPPMNSMEDCPNRKSSMELVLSAEKEVNNVLRFEVDMSRGGDRKQVHVKRSD